MIDRYTRPDMGKVWSLQNRFMKMLEVEKAVAKAQGELKIIPLKAAQSIQKRGHFSLGRISEIEKTTKHDVIAFVSSVAEQVGKDGRYVHFGLTSSDVLDTAISLQVREAVKILNQSLDGMEKSLKKLIKQHKFTLCAGRTHGMHAEPTTFGFKMAGFLAELKRHRQRIDQAEKQMLIAKLSGAVGTYSAQSEKVERRVAALLKLTPETIATQVIPRDRHAELIAALALLGCGLERLAVELRHLQRTEVAEVIEGFTPGQKGSSAMPHKKNPISAENITGQARLLRGYALAAFENVALWHERDISHSAVERVIFPDAFIVADYAVDRMASLLDGLYVNKLQMRNNMDLSRGMLFTSHILLKLVEVGVKRETAYAWIQELSHGLRDDEHLSWALKNDLRVSRYLSAKQIDEVFSGKKHCEGIKRVIGRT